MLERIKKNGERLGISGLEMVDAGWLRENEPNLSPDIECALVGPTAAVINPYETVHALAENAIANGVEVLCGIMRSFPLRKKQTAGVCTRVMGKNMESRVINAAGLYTDKISLMAGIEAPKIIPWKGEEFILDKHLQRPTKERIIFPVPEKHTKGILLIPTVDGNTMIGPTAKQTADAHNLTTSRKGKEVVLIASRNLCLPLARIRSSPPLPV